MKNPLNKIIREIYPKTYVTPIRVMWSLRLLVMGDYVPLQNPPFDTQSDADTSDT